METERYSTVDYLLMGILALFALLAALLMVWQVTERLPHLEDEIAYIFQARTFAHGALWAPVPEDTSAFFLPFVLNIGDKRVGKYTIGWPLVLAIGERFKVGWLVNPLLGALNVMLIYAVARDLYDRQIGVTAGILAGASPFFLIQSSTYMSHAAASLWVALLLWSLLRGESVQDAGRSGRGWAALSGAALGMLALTRSLTAVALGVVLGSLLLLRAIRQRQPVTGLISRYWLMAVLAVTVAALQPLYAYLVSGDPTTNFYTLVWEYDRVGFGPEFGRYGHTIQQGLYTSYKDLELWASDLFGWPYVSWLPIIPGVIAGIRWARPGRKIWPVALLLSFVSLVLIHTAYWIGARVYGPRYFYEALTGVTILAAVGLRAVGGWLEEGIRLLTSGTGGSTGEPSHIGRRAFSPALALLLAAGLAVDLGIYLPGRTAEWHGLYGISREPLEELEEIRQTDRVLILVRGDYWRQYGMFFYLNSPWYDGPYVAAHDKTMNRSQALIVEYSEYEVWFYNEGVFSKTPAPYPE